MLKIQNLNAQLEDKKILNGIDLTVKPGEIHVILGPNGSGKSTLGRVLVGDENYEVSDGSIEFDGADFLELETAERAQAGFFLSFQSPPELDGVSTREFLFAAKKAMEPDFASSFKFKKSLKENLEEMRLGEEFMEREMNKGASGGERRKMEIVSLLTLNPKVAFLDEPDSGTDVDAIRAIGVALREFMEDKTKSIILVTHTEKFIKEVPPTHVHVLVKGKIVKSGGPELVDHVHQHGFDEWLVRKGVLGNLRMVG
jgi:Fe-S cluster assembly ATP-binding protein